MNVKLLRKVKAQITKHPDSYTYNWLQNGCGTRACIAGHVLLLGRKDFKGKSIDEISEILQAEHHEGCFTGPARKLLKISLASAQRLFIYWPKQFSKLYDPEVAAARIEHFIKTKGKE